MKKLLKSAAGIVFSLAAASPFYSQTISKTQMIRSDHWIYDSMYILESETKRTTFCDTGPLTAGEIEFYFKQFDRESLSDSGKEVYDQIDNFLHTRPKGLYPEVLRFALTPSLNPEVYYKSNSEIQWTFPNNYYKDNFATIPIKVALTDYFTGEMDLHIGQNQWAMRKSDNYTNLPLSFKEFDFYQPTFAYGAAGASFDKWGFNTSVSRTGLRVGKTLTGSIVYNDTFMTNAVFQLNVYSNYFKYNMNVVQISQQRGDIPEKYLYMHQFQANFWKRVRFTFVEATLVSGSFGIQNLNPFNYMHSFGLWGDVRHDKTSQYMGVMLEFYLCKGLRLYVNYCQNESTAFYEAPDGFPDGIGWQGGLDLTLPSKKGGYWHGQIEGIWTTPWLYLRHGPESCFWSTREDMQSHTISRTWMGTPYGADCVGFQIEGGYEKPGKWSAKIGYALFAHGENTIDNLVDGIYGGKYKEPASDAYDSNKKLKDGYYEHVYYPAADKSNADKNNDKERSDAAMKRAEDKDLTGTVQFRQDIILKGSYIFNKYAQLNAQAIYSFVINNNNITGNFQHGIEFAVSCKCQFN